MGKDFNKDLSKDFENKPLDLMTPQESGNALSAEPGVAAPKAEATGVEAVVAEPAGVEPVIAGPTAPHTPAAESAPQPPAPEPAVATPESTERTG